MDASRALPCNRKISLTSTSGSSPTVAEKQTLGATEIDFHAGKCVVPTAWISEKTH
jgi:hypothetical protein